MNEIVETPRQQEIINETSSGLPKKSNVGNQDSTKLTELPTKESKDYTEILSGKTFSTRRRPKKTQTSDIKTVPEPNIRVTNDGNENLCTLSQNQKEDVLPPTPQKKDDDVIEIDTKSLMKFPQEFTAMWSSLEPQYENIFI